jgi:hypothetical protein
VDGAEGGTLAWASATLPLVRLRNLLGKKDQRVNSTRKAVTPNHASHVTVLTSHAFTPKK